MFPPPTIQPPPHFRYHIPLSPLQGRDLLTFSFILFWVWAAALTIAIWALRIAQRLAIRMPRIAAEPVFLEGPVKDVGDGKFPRVAVVLPIKGVDDDTHLNIEALLSQDYPEYRLIFSVESDD